MKKMLIFTDGGARGNPGQGALGVIIKDTDGNTIHSYSEIIGHTTNNIAEYKALIKALRLIIDKKIVASEYVFHLDSLLVVQQVKGVYKVKQKHLQVLLGEVKVLEKLVGKPVSFQAVPREANYEADKLVNEALDK